MIIATAEGPRLGADYVRLLRQRRVDGFVLALADSDDPATRTELERVQVPCVLYDRQVEWLDASCVLLDHAPSARIAGAHLLGLGHRRIGFVAGTPTVRVTPEVEHGLRLAMEGVPDAELLVEEGEFSEDYGRNRTLELLRGVAPPTALVAGNAQIAHGVLQALASCGAAWARSPGAPRTADVACRRPAAGRDQLGLPARRAQSRGAAPAAARRRARRASWCAHVRPGRVVRAAAGRPGRLTSVR